MSFLTAVPSYMNKTMDWSPQTNYQPFSEALNTPNLAKSSLIRRQRPMRALIFVYIYIIEEVAHSHAQSTALEWFSSTPGLVVVLRLLSKICW